MRMFVFIVMLALLGGCAEQSGNASSPSVVLTDAAQRDKHVGDVITVRGIINNTKIPNIFGVQVALADGVMRGQLAQATGVLERWDVTQADIDQQTDAAALADRGPGVYYRLRDFDSDDTAHAYAVTK